MNLTNRQLFLSNMAQTSPEPLLLEVVAAKGIELYGANGEVWIDLISGINVSSIGHSHPEVIAAVSHQASSYMHLMVYGELVQTPQVALAAKLLKHLPDSLSSVYFVNSGSEAIEGAMKLAKRHTGRYEIISFENAYHGSTHGALSVMGSEFFKNSFRPLLPGIRQLRYNQKDDLNLISNRTAAVIIEMVQGEAGAVVPDQGYIKKVAERCRETGTLLIVDEIQTGFNRTGQFMAFMHEDVVPDILVLGKSLGGGMPMGAFISEKKLMDCLSVNPVLGHITTFGGHPVCCAAALAALNIAERFDINTINRQSSLFRELLVHPAIKDITGRGLMLGVDLGTEAFNRKVINQCILLGVFTDWFLFAPHKMRIAPPLIISEAQIRHACAVILRAIDIVLMQE